MIETQLDSKQRKIRIATLFFIGFVITFCAVFLYSPTFKSHADDSGVSDSTPKVSAKMNSVISLTVDDSVIIAAAPISTGAFASQPMNISIRTNSPSGYKVMMSALSGTAMTSENTDDTIESITESVTSDAMPVNTWGYSLDNTTFHAIPASDSPVTIRQVDVRPNENQRTTTVNYGVKVDTTLAMASYRDTLVITALVNDVPDECEGFYCIDTMQEMTTAVCALTPTPSAEAYIPTYTYVDDDSLVPYRVLKDTRDNQDYLVAKFADGNCWMIQNMNLELNKNVPLTSDTTELDVASWTPANDTVGKLGWWEDPETGEGNYYHVVDENEYSGVYSVKPFKGSSWADYIVSYEHIEDRESGGNGVVSPLESAYDDTALSKAEHVGILYSYDAAMHICPKGWQLPNGSRSFENAAVIPGNQRSFRQLLEAYGWENGALLNGTGEGGIFFLGHNPWNFIPSGAMSTSDTQTYGRPGTDSDDHWRQLLWTNHRLDEEYAPTEALEVEFYDGVIFLEYMRGDNSMYSARCVAK